MILRDWLYKNKMGGNVIAAKLGVAQATIYRTTNGAGQAGKDLALKIESFTKGEVSRAEALWPKDFIEIDENGYEQTLLQPKIHDYGYWPEEKDDEQNGRD